MYHSWLTFVLLLWACLIWTVRSRHQFAMLCSPCILLYGLTLCCLRYVWAMELPELPTTLGPVSLHQLGLEHTRYPCLDLGAMVSVARRISGVGRDSSLGTQEDKYVPLIGHMFSWLESIGESMSEGNMAFLGVHPRI